jgi:hypothetical protein
MHVQQLTLMGRQSVINDHVNPLAIAPKLEVENA